MQSIEWKARYDGDWKNLIDRSHRPHSHLAQHTEQETIIKNPMNSAPMMKKSNFFAAQDKENLPEYDTVTVFTPEEGEKFKTESVRCWSDGKRIYQQSAAFILMLNTGLRTGELLGLLNSDIDLENRVMHLQRGVKEISKRDGTDAQSGREIKIGKLKSAASKRDVPLNSTAIKAIEEITQGKHLRGKQPPCSGRERQLYTPRQLPQTILPYPQGCRH